METITNDIRAALEAARKSYTFDFTEEQVYALRDIVHVYLLQTPEDELGRHILSRIGDDALYGSAEIAPASDRLSAIAAAARDLKAADEAGHGTEGVALWRALERKTEAERVLFGLVGEICTQHKV